MRLIPFDAGRGADITRFGTHGVRGVPLARATELARYSVLVMHLDPGGAVGRHEAVVDQLFAVVAGSGWAEGADAARVEVAAGQAVLWEAGEEHAAGTDVGLTALVVEADELSPLD
ncbi:MAG TPA: hypothetical protein VFS29_05450 [Motilibacteraceae bacterium]|nr:hypothetical protein [Motilibacteraceae bacterium]